VADVELTLHEAAAALGVHYMTAYRYVRLGVLPATKVGGTWRVHEHDLDELRNRSVEPVSGRRGGRPPAPWADRLEARLLAGDGRGGWGVIEAALAAGVEPDEIYLEVLSPALRSIGRRWEEGEIDISLEHRASGIAMRLIGRLGPRFVRRGRTRGAVVVGAPAGERHSLPVAMLADLVRQQGWEVSDLGADVPESSFVHAVLTTPDVVAVGISVTTADHLPAAASAIAALRDSAPEVLLVVGGAAVRDEAHAFALGAHAAAWDGRSFAALLQPDAVAVDDETVAPALAIEQVFD
jgi:excisionase family DNA binding protein